MGTQRTAPTERATGQRGTAAAQAIVVVDHRGALLPSEDSGTRLDLAELHWLAVRAGAEAPHPDTPAPSAQATQRLEQEVAARGWPPARPTRRTDSTDVTPPRRPAPAADHRLITPVALALTPAGFTLFGHDGNVRAHLGSRELASAMSFLVARDLDQANEHQARRLGHSALPREDFERLSATLLAAGALISMDQDARLRTDGRAQRELRRSVALQHRRAQHVDQALARTREEARREGRTGRTRTKVVPVNNEGNPLLALGLLMAHAAALDGGRLTETYKFVPDWCDRTVPALTGDEAPAIYLFSNYIWSHGVERREVG
jgi:hypothetical protein